MVFNATFNNISVILVEESVVPGENHQPVASHWQTLSHNGLLEEQEQVQNYNKKFILMINSAIQCLMYLVTLKMLQNIN